MRFLFMTLLVILLMINTLFIHHYPNLYSEGANIVGLLGLYLGGTADESA